MEPRVSAFHAGGRSDRGRHHCKSFPLPRSRFSQGRARPLARFRCGAGRASHHTMVQYVNRKDLFMRQFNAVAVAALMLALSAGVGPPIAYGAGPEPLQLEAKVPLGEVSGRIDHMAVDLQRKRLFVAELENNSLGLVDLAGHKLVRTINGFKKPQGVGYVPANDTLYVANGGDGSLRMFEGQDYAAAGQIDLGDDTDNVRVDTAGGRVFVSHRGNMVTGIDSVARRKISDVMLNGNVESFQLDPASRRMFVNLSDQPAIAVVDRDSAQLTATWKLAGAGDNYAMTLDPDAKRVLVAFRQPAKLGA